MRITRKRLIALIVPLVIIVGGYIFLQSPYVLNKIRLTLVSALEKQLKRPVTVEAVSGNPLTHLRISRVEIASSPLTKGATPLHLPPYQGGKEGGQPDTPPIIAADEIRVRYNLWAMLRRKFVITALDIAAPRINAVVDENGKLNLAELMPEPSADGGSPIEVFISRVNIEDGTVRFDDKQRHLAVTIEGIYSSVEGPKEKWAHSGNFEVRDGRVRINSVVTPINEFKTSFAVEESEGELTALRLVFGNSVLTINGRATNLDTDAPSAETQVSLRLDLSDLQGFLPNQYHIEGVLQVDAQASGTLPEISGTVGLKLPAAKLNQLRVENLVTRAAFTESGIKLTQLEGSVASGRISGEADLQFGSDTQTGYSGSLQLTGLDAAQILPLLFDLPLVKTKGEIEGNVAFRFSQPDLSDLNFNGDLALTRIYVDDNLVGDLQSHCAIADGQLTFRTDVAGAHARVQGTPGFANQRNLQWRISNVDLAKLSKIFDVPGVTGTAEMDGTSADETPLTGNLRIPNPTWNGIALGELSASLRYTNTNQLFLEPITLAKGGGSVRVDGSIGFAEAMPVALQLRVDSLHVQEFVPTGFTAAGVLDGALELNGTLQHLNGGGQLHLVGGRVANVAFDPLTLPITVEDSTVIIPGFEVSVGGQRGVLNARLTPELTYTVDFESAPMQLSALSRAAGLADLPLEAELVVVATGKGALSNPNAHAELLARNIAYDAHALSDLAVKVAYANNALQVEATAFDAAVSAQGHLDLTASQPFQATLQAQDWDLTPVIRIFEDTTEASLTGTLKANGVLTDVSQLSSDLSLEAVSVRRNGGHVLNPDPISLSYRDNVLKVESLALVDARDKRAYLSVADAQLRLETSSGERLSELGIRNPKPGASAAWHSEIRNRKPLQDVITVERLEAHSDGFALEHLTDIIGIPTVATGLLAYNLTAKGRLSQPALTLELSSPELRLPANPIAISQANASLRYTDGHLEIPHIGLRLFDNPIQAHGDASLDFNDVYASTVNLDIAVPEFDLQSLMPLAPQLTTLSGQLDFHAALNGQLRQPQLVATLAVKDTHAQLQDFPVPIEGVTLDVSAYSGAEAPEDLIKVDLRSASWQLAETSYRASGNWRLPADGWSPPLPRGDGRGVKEATPSDSPLSRGREDEATPSADGWSPPLPRGDGRGVKESTPLASLMSHIERFSRYSLRCQANQMNLGALAKAFVGEASPVSEGAVDATLRVSGKGVRIEDMVAVLTAENLSVNVGAQQLRNTEPLRLRFSERRLSAESFQIGQEHAWVSVEGGLNLDGEMDMTAKFDELPLAVLLPAATVSLFNTFIQFDGQLDSDLRVTGNFTAPVIEASWQASGNLNVSETANAAASEAVTLTDTGQATYRNQMLTLEDTIRVASDDNIVSVKGTIPIDLTFSPVAVPERFLDDPIAVRIQGEGKNLEFLSLFHPLIETIGGVTNIDLSMRGTTASPYLRGRFTLRDGLLKLAGLEQPISHGTVELLASQEMLQFTSVRFQVGESQYDAQVSLRLEGLLPADLKVNRFAIQNARITDFLPKNQEPSEPAFPLKAMLNAEMQLRVPLDQFILPGETAWTPTIAPFNLETLITYIEGALTVQDIFLQGLDYDIRNDRPIEVRLTKGAVRLEDGFTLADVNAVGEGSERLKIVGFGVWELAGRLRYHMEMQNFDLAFLAPFLPKAYTFSGLLNAALELRGTGTKPEMTLGWSTSQFAINQADVDTFAGQIAYKDGLLTLGQPEMPVRFSIGLNRCEAQGIIPFGVSLAELKVNSLSEPIECRVDGKLKTLDFLPLIFPQLGVAEGSGAVHVTIGGSILAPQFRGFVSLKDVGFDVPDSFVNIINTNVELDLTNNGMQIRRFDGKFNDGPYRVEGRIQWERLQPNYIDLAVALPEGFTYDWPGFFQMRCRNARLAMKGAVATQGAVQIPPLNGSIHIAEGQYERDWREMVKQFFEKGAAVQAEVWADVPILRDLRLDIGMIIPDQFRVVSELGGVNMEVSVNGKIVGPIQRPIFNGRVDLLEGEFSFVVLKRNFTITEGSYVENNSSVVFNPYYEIHAKTSTPINNVILFTTGDQLRTRDVNVSMTLKGNLNDQQTYPEFEVEVLGKEANEDYQLGQTQVLSILALGRVDPTFSQGASGEEFSLSDLALRQSEQYIGSRFAALLGLDAAEFELDTEDLEKSKFLVTKSLTSRLALTYASTFGLHGEPRIGVEYQIKQHLAVRGERNERGKYGVDLKVEQRF